MVRNICSLLLLFFLLPAPLCQKNRKPMYISDEMSWWDAQTYCRRHHTDLLTLRNMEEDQELANSDKVWIGLYRESSISEWKWSRRGRKASFTNWEYGMPVDDWNCVTKEASNKGWRSEYCGEKHAFLCYDSRLVLIQELKTWEEALQHCRALQAMNATLPPTAYLNHRYDLATLRKPNDLSKALKMVKKAGTNEVWTGLRFLAGQWLWVGGEPVKEMSLPLCPAQQHYCGALVKNIGLVEIKDCTERRNFLCYRKPAKRNDFK